MSLDRLGQGPTGARGYRDVDAVSEWCATCMLHCVQPGEAHLVGGVGALGVVGPWGRDGERTIQGLSTIYAGRQLRSYAREGERLRFEAEPKQRAWRARHGIEQADGHVQQAEQLGLRVVLPGQLAADVSAVGEQSEALEVRTYVGPTILEHRIVQLPPTIGASGWTEGHVDAIADVQGAAKTLGGASGRAGQGGDSTIFGYQEADNAVRLLVVLEADHQGHTVNWKPAAHSPSMVMQVAK